MDVTENVVCHIIIALLPCKLPICQREKDVINQWNWVSHIFLGGAEQ